MPTLTYEAIDFPNISAPQFNGLNQIVITWNELVWAIITCGYGSNNQMFQYGLYSGMDSIGIMVPAYLAGSTAYRQVFWNLIGEPYWNLIERLHPSIFGTINKLCLQDVF